MEDVTPHTVLKVNGNLRKKFNREVYKNIAMWYNYYFNKTISLSYCQHLEL